MTTVHKNNVCLLWPLRCVVLTFAVLVFLTLPHPAAAFGFIPECALDPSVCLSDDQEEIVTAFNGNEAATVSYFTSAMSAYQDWLENDFFGKDVAPALMSMTQQFSAVMMTQTLAVGAMFDAKTQLETQTLFQQLSAQAHKDYQPSFGMCVFGTNVRSLAAADDNAYLTESAMADREIARELGKANSSGALSPGEDKNDRLQQFSNRYCNKTDNDAIAGNPQTGLGQVCNAAAGATSINKDIDYMRTILLPRTLQLDFSASTAAGDQQDVIAMSNNIYAHNVFDNISADKISTAANQSPYMDARAVEAKRSVAETSFNAIVAMKTEGSSNSTDTAKYMTVLMQELGMPKDDISTFLGSRPSYMAQMEVLAKKIYQRPEFYTELYDTPVNVKRRSVAMQAIGLMLDRDIYKSYLRSEAVMSVLLESRLIPVQSKVSKEINDLQQQP